MIQNYSNLVCSANFMNTSAMAMQASMTASIATSMTASALESSQELGSSFFKTYSGLDICPISAFNKTVSFISDTQLELDVQEMIKAFEALFMQTKSSDDQATCPTLEFNVSQVNSHGYNVTLPHSPYQHLYVSDSLPVNADWLQQVDRSMANPKLVKVIEQGISVGYLIKDADGRPIAIYKPAAQAGGSADNPKGIQINPGLKGAEAEASIRELGARLVGGDFCNTAELHMIKIILNGQLQEGSLQKFIENDGTGSKLMQPSLQRLLNYVGIDPSKKLDELTFMDGMKLGQFMADKTNLWRYGKEVSLPNDTQLFSQIGKDVHKIGILDIMIQNADRLNTENFLFKDLKGRIKLFAIDHNLAFPADINPMLNQVIWMQSPYSLEPFDQDMLEFIKQLDIETITGELAKMGMHGDRIKAFKVMSTLVKMGTEAGLSLRDIGELVCIRNPFVPSTVVMKLVDEAKQNSGNEQEFFQHFKMLVEKKIAEAKEQIDKQGVSDAAKPFYLLQQPDTYREFNVWERVAECALDSSKPHCLLDAKLVEETYRNGSCTTGKALLS